MNRTYSSLMLGIMVSAGAVAAENHDIMDMSFEDLMQLEVTSVSRKSQKLSDAASAIYVITSDEIRRSGVTSIPEALRLAPGVEVARIDSNKWAISSRGFNGRFANKLQVLIDGRSVYTPSFSGVYWDAQDTVIEDIDRIEVIRGPGATLWGSNAVNGVVNVITKQAKNTQGGEFTFGTGTYEKRFGSLRYGTQWGDKTFGRVYAKGFARGDFDTVLGSSSHDEWESYRGGFRIDHDAGENNSMTLQGDVYKGDINQGLVMPSLTSPYSNYQVGAADNSGFNLLGRWKKAYSLTSDLTVQAYYDHTYRNDFYLTEQRDTLDIDAQHRFTLLDSHEIVWGLSYRWTRPTFSERFPAFIDQSRPVFNLAGGFLQDEVTLIPDRLKFTFGAKLEYNSYTGMEGQPNVRLLWSPAQEHSFWGAISRAVRIPNVGERQGSVTAQVFPPNSTLNPGPLPVQLVVQGNNSFKAEVLWAYELGYRFKPRSDFSTDIALFYNDYSRLRSNSEQQFILGSQGQLIALSPLGNSMQGETYGAEFAIDWRPQNWWLLQLNYSYLRMNLREASGDPQSGAPAIAGASPQQQVSLRSSFNPLDTVDFDLWLRYVDRVPTSGFPAPGQTVYIPSYVTLDARMAWRPVKNIELSLVGQNLLDNDHPEIAQETFAPILTTIPRSVYAKIEWRF